MRGAFPDFETLYAAGSVQRLAYHSARVEAEGYGRWVRLQEVAEVAQRMGYERIGVAYCPDMQREAALTSRYLRLRGHDVVLPTPDGCDPVGQAALFHDEEVQLIVVAGMCVGHDALLLRHARAPVTCLVVRDLRLRHNPVGAIYARRGYLKSALYARRRPDGRPPFAGWTDDLLHDLAQRVRDRECRAKGPPPCRLEQIMDFAQLAGARHLGLVYCSGFRTEARDLVAVLGTNGFRVASVCCKTGAVPKERLGIRDGEKVRPGRPEMICNPLAQAELLEREGVELVLLMGQCVGHDAATIGHLHTPAVFVAAKDRVLAHNTAAALYAREDVDAPDGRRFGRDV
jgi:uncharacterized metal-binding protein